MGRTEFLNLGATLKVRARGRAMEAQPIHSDQTPAKAFLEGMAAGARKAAQEISEEAQAAQEIAEAQTHQRRQLAVGPVVKTSLPRGFVAPCVKRTWVSSDDVEENIQSGATANGSRVERHERTHNKCPRVCKLVRNVNVVAVPAHPIMVPAWRPSLTKAPLSAQVRQSSF